MKNWEAGRVQYYYCTARKYFLCSALLRPLHTIRAGRGGNQNTFSSVVVSFLPLGGSIRSLAFLGLTAGRRGAPMPCRLPFSQAISIG